MDINKESGFYSALLQAKLPDFKEYDKVRKTVNFFGMPKGYVWVIVPKKSENREWESRLMLVEAKKSTAGKKVRYLRGSPKFLSRFQMT